jgi:hypothetical protein
MSSESSIGRGQDFGFKSERWHGLRTLSELNGSSKKYRNVLVDVVDIHTCKIISRMPLGAAIRKFN